MKLILESTEKIVVVNGVEARVWCGYAGAVPVHAFVLGLMVDAEEDQSQFEKELREKHFVLSRS